MPATTAKIRLYVTGDLAEGARIDLNPDQAQYLFGVMRLNPGDALLVFNGRDGEWAARVSEARKKGGALEAEANIRPQTQPPDLWLLFAPIKRARTDFIVEKAAEMGCRRVSPVFTRFTNAERVNRERLQAHAVEAAEQCGLVSVPEVAEPVKLAAALDAWDDSRRLLFADESGESEPAAEVLREFRQPYEAPDPWAILIGPEGGFAPEEAERLTALPWVAPVCLGPRILRADTAAVAALAVWQSILGDWT